MMSGGAGRTAPPATQLKAIARRVSDEPKRYQDVVYDGKKLVLRVGDVRRADRAGPPAGSHLRAAPLHPRLHPATACSRCCRRSSPASPSTAPTSGPDDGYVGDRDRSAIEAAIRTAKRRNPVIDESLFDFVRGLLLLEHPEGLSRRPAWQSRRDFVLRFQQLTGPVTAKGVEDTAFYRYFPLAALCEVGGDPSRIGMSVEEFHRRNAERLRSFPHGLSATATHDTKRGEDTRARLLVLSEVPERWEAALARWRQLNRALRADVGGWEAPDPRDELLFYQTLVGTLPAGGRSPRPEYRQRLKAYMEKAIHEAKVHTSWVNPNNAFDEALARFVDGGAGSRSAAARSWPTCASFMAPLIRPGYWNGAGAGAAEGRLAGRARHLPGDRAVGLLAGRSRQPAAGGLRPAPAAAGAAGPEHRAPARGPAGRADAAAGRRAGEDAGAPARPRLPPGPAPAVRAGALRTGGQHGRAGRTPGVVRPGAGRGRRRWW